MNESYWPKREKIILVLFSVMAGVIYNHLFYEKAPGVSYPLYVLVVLNLFWWSRRKDLTLGATSGWLVLIPVMLLSLTFSLYSNVILRAVNFLLIPLLVVAHTLLVTDKHPAWFKLSFLADIFKKTVIQTIEAVPKIAAFAVEELEHRESSSINNRTKNIGIGLVISIPLLLIVLPLLSSADLVFNHYITNFTKLLENVEFNSIIRQIIIIIFVSIYILGYLWSFQVKPSSTQNVKFPVFSWDPTVTMTVLFVLNVVYLLFSIIQFSYLYGGENNILPAAFTYSQYARRGFFELVAVTILNLSIILSIIRFVKKSNGGTPAIVRFFLSLLVAFSANMLFSAHFKMSLYESVYGLTYLRLFVHYFMGMLLVLLLLALIKVWLNKLPLAKGYIIVILVSYTALNFINVDKIIARNNLHMYYETGIIDVWYLQRLSYDAVPELIMLTNDKNAETARQAKDCLVSGKQDLLKKVPWQSFNYSRYRSGKVLTKALSEETSKLP